MSLVTVNTTDLDVNAYFKIIEVENAHKSNDAGFPVYDQVEVAEIHKASDKHNIAVKLADEFYRREGNKIITVKEHFSDAYQAFISGSDQQALGTPLSNLLQFGISQSDLSLCRANKIYSVESLTQLSHSAVRGLGMRVNVLREAAEKCIAQTTGSEALVSEVTKLRAELAAMRAENEMATVADDGEFATLSNSELCDKIEDATGTRPDGRTKREVLLNLVKGM